MKTFQKQDRLRSAADFKRVYEGRCSVSNQWIIVYGARNELANVRLGLSVSRKFGGAPARNRFKRLVREAFRLSRERLPAGLDLIVLPRNSKDHSLSILQQSLKDLAAAVARRLKRPENA